MLENKEIRLLDCVYGSMPEDSFSSRIYKLRKINGVSREEFAEKVKIHASTVKAWEDGAKTPTKTSIKKLCTAFGVHITYFDINQNPFA